MHLAERRRTGSVARAGAPRYDASLLTADDLHLFNEGTHVRLWERLGSHPRTVDGVSGTSFAVFAPNAASVSVVGDFNGWKAGKHPLEPVAGSGVWEAFVPGVERGDVYKYRITSRQNAYTVDKADPYAVRQETPPRTGSVVWDLDYRWRDAKWMAGRARAQAPSAPISIYEVHLGSWRRVPEDGNRPLTYREAARSLAQHALELGFTHVELLPVMEHPFAGSWGYQETGYFAPTSRFGTPQDFMYLVDTLHQAGLGVILDWVPSHFPSDEHGLVYFDGTHLYEHADWRQGYHPDWSSCIFNYGRNEVRAFLLSSALYWLDVYHADGLRVDAVASMLHLDYSRRAGEWIPNKYGGWENLEAISLLRRLNDEVRERHPDALMIAEESTAWPMVSRPTYVGGLGFDLKWDLGWMNDTLDYMSLDPVFRKFHHTDLTFRRIYQYSENFVLPLSHDEVVHLKRSLLSKMPGDDWQKFASLRLLFGYMWAQPGKKLLFMGGEFGQRREWNHDASLDWDLLADPRHAGLELWVRDLNRLYASEPALHAFDFDPRGFEWIDCHDADHSVVSLERRGKGPRDRIAAVFNFTPVPRSAYRIGVDVPGDWIEVLNGDAEEYGGSGVGNRGRAVALPAPAHGRAHSLSLALPPLAAVFFRPAEESAVAASAARAAADEPETDAHSSSAASERLPGTPSLGQ
ncbi:MAG TPA: 1,4-alpha-glucan branching protein GlgB [Thermoanaerobaculia bacterium]|nr:1,4-alpha-glucan branching protein GlgB [Thermoanaerobaculia bacterium]